jgi:hypothetical protein
MRYLFTVVLLICWASTLADTVVPRDSVVNWVNVREAAIPGPDIPTVGHLHPGESATFLSDESGYYQIRLEDGVIGFVSKTWTERLADVGRKH